MNRGKYRWFAWAFGVTLSLLILVTGLVIVDTQGRRMSFGDEQPAIQVKHLDGDRARLEVKVLGFEGSWDVTAADRAFQFVCDFCCIPHS